MQPLPVMWEVPKSLSEMVQVLAPMVTKGWYGDIRLTVEDGKVRHAFAQQRIELGRVKDAPAPPKAVSVG